MVLCMTYPNQTSEHVLRRAYEAKLFEPDAAFVLTILSVTLVMLKNDSISACDMQKKCTFHIKVMRERICNILFGFI